MKLKALATAHLSDGRIQFWCINDKGKLLSTWKLSNAPGAGWFALTFQDLPPGVSAVTDVTASNLTDGRLQMWVIDSAGSMWTRWKLTLDVHSDWSAWDIFEPTFA